MPSPTPNNPPEPIAYNPCIICHPVSSGSAHGSANAINLFNLYSPIPNSLASTYSPVAPKIAPEPPNIAK